MTPDIIEALQPVAEAFSRLGIPYCIGGSVASSFHSEPRRTNDIDLVAAVEAQHVPELVEQLQDSYYIDGPMIKDAIRRQASFNVIHFATSLKIDIFIVKDTPFMRQQMQRAQPAILPPGNQLFMIASREDTILAKLDWYRKGGETSQRQWDDILKLLRHHPETLDLVYLHRTAPLAGVADLLECALGEVGIA